MFPWAHSRGNTPKFGRKHLQFNFYPPFVQFVMQHGFLPRRSCAACSWVRSAMAPCRRTRSPSRRHQHGDLASVSAALEALISALPQSPPDPTLGTLRALLPDSRKSPPPQDLAPRLAPLLSPHASPRALPAPRLAAARLAALLALHWYAASPQEPFEFFARVVSSCETPGTTNSDASAAAVALGAISAIISCARTPSSLVEAVSASVAPLADAIRFAIFPPASLVRELPLVLSDFESPSSVESGQSSTRRNTRAILTADPSSSDSDAFAARSRPSSRSFSRELHLRICAIDTLTAIANVASLALIPHWSLFLPDRDGVVNDIGHERQKTLATLILYDQNDSVRRAAVAAVSALLSGAWRLTRPTSSHPPHHGTVSAFTSTHVRVQRVCSALYVITASCIRREPAPPVLSRLVKLAAELCSNVVPPIISIDHVASVMVALRVRILDVVGTDYTSRSASMSCLASSLLANSALFGNSGKRSADNVAAVTLDLAGIASDALQVLQHRNIVACPSAEVLAVLRALAVCDKRVVANCWSALAPHLVSFSSTDDHVLRLHTVRCIHALVPDDPSPSSWPWPASPSHIWESFVEPACQDSFHTVRSCALACIETLFSSGKCDSPLAVRIVLVAGNLLAFDDSLNVRAAAAKALCMLPLFATCKDDFNLISRSYQLLVAGLERDANISVRSKCMLAAGTLLDRQHQSRYHTDAGHPTLEYLETLERHRIAAMSTLTPLPAEQFAGLLGPSPTSSPRSDWEVFRASAIRALGCCIGPMLISSDCEFRHLAVKRVLAVVSRVCCIVASADECAKVRWNGCRVLERFIVEHYSSAGDTSSDLPSCAVEDAVKALADALESSTNYKVRIGAIRALRAIVSSLPRALTESNAAVVLCAISRMKTITCSVEAKGKQVAPMISALHATFSGEKAELVVSILSCLEKETCAKLGRSGVVSCDAMFEALWQRSSLPSFTMRTLSTATIPLSEEDTAAMDCWISLPEQLRGAFLRASWIALHLPDNRKCDESQCLLTAAGSLLAPGVASL
jgi:Domain of unknown function (DUF4042)